jgi:dipeptidyl aminopeptidase/acylaminoacyl peptidase
MRLDPDSSADPEVAQFLHTVLGESQVRFAWQRFYLHGPAAISPDGRYLAVVMAAAGEMDVASSQGLWLMDLEDSSVAPRQLASGLHWQTALPHWSSQPAQPRGLQWTQDGRGLVVAALSNDLRLPLLLAYHVDVETGVVTPAVDFSEVEDRDAFFRPAASGAFPPRTYVPWTLALAPNANVLVMATDLGGVVTLYGATLPPSGEMPQPLAQLASPGYEVLTRSSAATNGTLLVYGLLLHTGTAP